MRLRLTKLQKTNKKTQKLRVTKELQKDWKKY